MVPFGGFAVALLWPDGPLGGALIWGAVSTAVSLATLYTTAMIYRTLKPIAQWHHPGVVPGYLLLGPMSGMAIVNSIVAMAAGPTMLFSALTLVLIVAAALAKLHYWRSIDALPQRSTASAIGLTGVTARSIEWPHTEENFLLKEMGFRLARKHARRLRRLTAALAWGVPLLTTIAGMVPATPAPALVSAIGALSALGGVFIERWLFFAEARHTVVAYYGR
jgi:DMSO reductase anchor subunit